MSRMDGIGCGEANSNFHFRSRSCASIFSRPASSRKLIGVLSITPMVPFAMAKFKSLQILGSAQGRVTFEHHATTNGGFHVFGKSYLETVGTPDLRAI